MVNGALVRVLALVLTVAACSSTTQPTREAVVGTYVANHGKGVDTITVHADGTYEHVFEKQGQAVRRQHGKWSIEEVEGDEFVVFGNFEHWWRGFEVAGESFWYASPARRYGGIRFSLDDDLGWYFERTK